MASQPPLHPSVARVTDRIRARSRQLRTEYLAQIERAAQKKPVRSGLSCTNFAHGFAAFEPDDKLVLREARRPNIGIVSSYNDMLSAHQPFERFPQLIKHAAREAGGVAQFAGGVPAMCDGVTQGEPGMELSLFSRDVIAHGHRDRAVAQHVRRGAVPGHLRQDRARPADRRAEVRPPADDPGAGRADDLGPVERRRRRRSGSSMRRARSAATRCSNRSRSRITAPAPAPSTAPRTATRC